MQTKIWVSKKIGLRVLTICIVDNVVKIELEMQLDSELFEDLFTYQVKQKDAD